MKLLRRLIWPLVREILIDRMDEGGSIISFSTILYLSLNDIPKKIYVEKGYNALIDNIIEKAKEFGNKLVEAFKPQRNGIQDSIIEAVTEWRKQEEEEGRKEDERINEFITNFYKKERGTL